MKFAFFGYDFMADALDRLIEDGHELTALFTFPCDNVFNSNTRITARAQELNAPVITEKPTPEQIDEALNQGTELFLAAGYLYKIPPIDEGKAYGVNVHPSLLPKGRGMMPTPHILLHSPEASGITAHKITQDYDQGDILKQQALPLHPNEDVETLTARFVMTAPDFISDLLANLPDYWDKATLQNEAEATYWDAPDESMRSLNWTKSAKENEKIAHAFGRYGCLAKLDGEIWAVYDSATWVEEHNFTPGTITCQINKQVIIAIEDGFICLKELKRI